jgi:hypothetical protein
MSIRGIDRTASAALIGLLGGAAIMLALGAAGSGQNDPASQGFCEASPPLDALPTVPDLPSPRDADLPGVVNLNGSDAARKSGGTSVSGGALQISAASGASEYAVYSCPVGIGKLRAVRPVLNIAAGDQVWIGLADYAERDWKFQGPFPAFGTPGLANLDGDYVSPEGSSFIVVACDGSTVEAGSVQFSFDTPPVGYALDVKPLLDSCCSGCHNSKFATKNVKLDTYDNAKKFASKAVLMVQNDAMPPGGPLGGHEKNLLQAWVDGGMKP